MAVIDATSVWLGVQKDAWISPSEARQLGLCGSWYRDCCSLLMKLPRPW
jgi:hypothetical protein